MAEQGTAAARQNVPSHVLPPKKYWWKLILLFLDLWLIAGIMYYGIIRQIVRDIGTEEFSWVSQRMISNYLIGIITAGIIILAFVFRYTKSIQTRLKKDNDLRQDASIPVWLTVFDWGWPVLFTPTIVLLTLLGIAGLIINRVMPAETRSFIHGVMGAVAVVFFFINAIAATFKLKPAILVGVAASVFLVVSIWLLNSPESLWYVFRRMRVLLVEVGPLGYLFLAYIGFFLLRIIWIRGLFVYQVITPNRLMEQHGLSESHSGIPRSEWDVSIDTDDVILRFFGVGLMIIYFRTKERKSIINTVVQIGKKAKYATRATQITAVSG